MFKLNWYAHRVQQNVRTTVINGIKHQANFPIESGESHSIVSTP